MQRNLYMNTLDTDINTDPSSAQQTIPTTNYQTATLSQGQGCSQHLISPVMPTNSQHSSNIYIWNNNTINMESSQKKKPRAERGTQSKMKRDLSADNWGE